MMIQLEDEIYEGMINRIDLLEEAIRYQIYIFQANRPAVDSNTRIFYDGNIDRLMKALKNDYQPTQTS